MQKTLILVSGILFLLASIAVANQPQRWGADYFPNIPLVTHDGKKVRFFDDVIKDKVVLINFIYTTCPDSCPAETAQLTKVKRILGDRVGKDVYFYSISIDPKRDTPEVLKKYADKFNIGPGWTFLTGEESDIILLRKKLGLYSTDAEEKLEDHNLSMIMGNQKTGRWMKRSPFDNPYFIASQIGNWLHNWTQPDPNKNDYADAPELRTISTGESLFRTRCASCHTIGEGDIMKVHDNLLGPDLLGVTTLRDRSWLRRWIATPDKMIQEKDPIIMEMRKRYNDLDMPNLRLNDVEVEALIEHMSEETKRVLKSRSDSTSK